MSDSTTVPNTLELTVEIVAAHIGRVQVPAETLPALIAKVYGTLVGAAATLEAATAAAERPEPAVPVKRSVFPDYIICLEDGKKLNMLKRHLQAVYNLTPAQYRERWDLPGDYPMVAPSYASRRSTLAKSIGLGRAKPVAAQVPQPEPVVTRVPARRAKGSRG